MLQSGNTSKYLSEQNWLGGKFKIEYCQRDVIKTKPPRIRFWMLQNIQPYPQHSIIIKRKRCTKRRDPPLHTRRGTWMMLVHKLPQSAGGRYDVGYLFSKRPL